MVRTFIALLLCLFSFTAFSQDSSKKDPFTGLDRKAIIGKYGQPTIIEKTAEGGEVLIYKRTHEISGKSTNSNEGYRNTTTNTYSFTFNKQGKVIGWKAS